MALRGGTRFSVRCGDVFPAGCALVPESMGEVEDYDEKTGRRSPAKDKVTGQRVWQVKVMDLDPELGKRSRETTVKISADYPPAAPTGAYFEQVEFDGMTVTPYVANNGRMAYSLRATGMRAPAGVTSSKAAA
ncbi:transcriptional regulator [Micromonospora sp. NBC_01699]|uniref:transcriptional regulator n=1 Tax=Micromonospora sp. NBC_01699 TaxID=2975984 RepID=UPI002E28CCA6|nr:transcriptional regulator [Micromonospora sp. NBC_01699]